MRCQLIDSNVLSVDKVMEKDELLLREVEQFSDPLLHLYEWEKPSLTYGYFINPLLYLDEGVLQKNQIQWARRPTGGGIIFHITDFAFSFLIPSSHPKFSLNTIDNYLWINRLVMEIISPLLQESQKNFGLFQTAELSSPPFCMAKPTRYDILIGGKKIGGAAQRRTKQGLLHQGSLSIAMPCHSMLQSALLDGQKIIEAMHIYSCSLLENNWTDQDIKNMRKEIKRLFLKKLIKT